MPREFPLPAHQRRLLRSISEKNVLLSVSFGRVISREDWKAAWEVLVQRHPVLRESFTKNCDGVLEHDRIDPSWEEPDFTGMSGEEIGAAWEELQQREAERPFAEGSYPLWRVILIALPEGGSHLLCVFHPVLLDRESAALLLLEWFALLGGGVREDAPPLPSPPALVGAVDLPDDAQLSQTALENLDDSILQPFAFASTGLPEVESTAFTLEGPVFSKEVFKALEEVAGKYSATVEDVLAVCWGIALSRFSGERESLFQARYDLRPSFPGEHPVASGYFQCDIPVRISVRGTLSDETWRTALFKNLRESKKGLLADWDRLLPTGTALPAEIQFLPGEVHDLLHTRLPQWLGVDAKWSEPAHDGITLRVSAEKRGASTLHFQTADLHPVVARRLLEEWEKAVEQFTGVREEPAVPSAAAAESSKAESRASAEEDAKKGEDEPDLFSLSGAPSFSEELRSRLSAPGNPEILQWGEKEFPIALLQERARQTARLLRKSKLDPERPVLVCMRKSPELVYGLLGLLLDGWSARILDPLDATSELEKELSNGDWQAILVEEEVSTGESPCKRIVLGEGNPKFLSQSSGELSSKNSSPRQRIAFGPGGVDLQDAEFPVAGLSETIEGAASRFGLEQGARLLSTSAVATPAFLEEILLCVFSKALLVLPKEDLFATRSAFQETMALAEISHLRLPTPQWADWVHFLAELRQSLPQSLRRVAVFGGVGGGNMLRAWRELSGEQVVSHAVYSSAGLLGSAIWGELPPEDALIPAGSTFLGTDGGPVSCEVVDCFGAVLPNGVVGTLRFSSDVGEFSQAGGPISGFRDAMGNCFSTAQPGMPTAVRSQVSWRVRAALDRELGNREEVFNYLVLNKGSEKPAFSLWLVPAESDAPLPGWLSEVASRLSREGISISGVALLPKVPVDAAGNIDPSRLPETAKVPTSQNTPARTSREKPKAAPAKAPKESAAKPATGPQTVPDSVSMANPEIPFELQEVAEGGEGVPVLVFLGEPTRAVSVAAAFGRLLPDAYRILAPGPFTSGGITGMEAKIAKACSKFPTSVFVAIGGAWVETVGVLRAMGRSPDAANELYILGPEPEAAGGVLGKLRLAFGGMLRKGAGQGATRSLGFRRKSCPFPATVIFDGAPSETLLQCFPHGEKFDGDLSSAESIAGALRDVMTQPIEPSEPDGEEEPEEA